MKGVLQGVHNSAPYSAPSGSPDRLFGLFIKASRCARRKGGFRLHTYLHRCNVTGSLCRGAPMPRQFGLSKVLAVRVSTMPTPTSMAHDQEKHAGGGRGEARRIGAEQK